MKKKLKNIINLETIIKCFIWAMGFGIGYYLPNKLGNKTIVCFLCSMLLGTIFDLIGSKLLSSNYYKKSNKNKYVVTIGVYVTYLIVWYIANITLEHDLDNDFLTNLGSMIIIQITLLFINELRKRTINNIKSKRELKDEDLSNVTGGNEPEEFDWRKKGYVTPAKDSKAPGWKFEAVGNIEGQYFKKVTVENEKD